MTGGNPAARDLTAASAAQIQNAIIGGKDYFTEAGQAAYALRDIPDFWQAVRDSYGFRDRATVYAAMNGIEQFIDLGCGLAADPMPPLHEKVRDVIPDARVAYVDKDKMVATHARGLLQVDGRIAFAEADFTRTADVVRKVGEIIDLSRPVCLVFSNVLHLMRGSEAHRAVSNWKQHVVPGSYLVISHAGNEANGFTKNELADVRKVYAGIGLPFRASAASTLTDHYFKYLRMTDPAADKPGVVSVDRWGVREPEDPGRPMILGGVGVLT